MLRSPCPRFIFRHSLPIKITCPRGCPILLRKLTRVHPYALRLQHCPEPRAQLSILPTLWLMPQAITNAAVIPILEGVLNNGGGSYTARFGYENDNTVTETIAVGDSNKFSPTPTNRGQTTTFQVGRQHYAFNVNFNGSNLVWTLKGPDNTARTATASSSSTACPVPVANPGPSRTVATGSTVQLDGTGSTDPSGLPLTYQWSLVSKPSGSTATLSSATAAKPTFVSDKTGRFEVHLVVSDTYFYGQHCAARRNGVH